MPSTQAQDLAGRANSLSQLTSHPCELALEDYGGNQMSARSRAGQDLPSTSRDAVRLLRTAKPFQQARPLDEQRWLFERTVGAPVVSDRATVRVNSPSRIAKLILSAGRQPHRSR
jgi:hypothetical protein